MKYILALALALVLLIGSTVSAFPLLFDVWSFDDPDKIGPTLLGQISAYTGTESHAGNYNYFDYSGHPINGPTPTDYLSQAWLYYNTSSNTMSFNIIHNVDNGGGNYWNSITMDLLFMGMDYGVILQDDDPEPVGGFFDQGGGLMWADFEYRLNTDGGVVDLPRPSAVPTAEIRRLRHDSGFAVRLYTRYYRGMGIDQRHKIVLYHVSTVIR